ncbi:hypothetical protein SAMD00019534_034180 [Acytostelium subglobosum LB1]|uniref:hypothetical protein n=1 Tax=Acytostelium subglobosum LB1 TaxID=1410327 RepID=UPI000644F57B|nr:hypothetical protein SAMD00019534_034180 [Acytostelium subglobosum LB1]GAM20243.1 hypothetical protein SAMD00019534_034180 [Acytostelium subglobosum LB1]|eukprot:XP_012759764.1 hypothetical protein SAMD00019534_034180 [Acytostelium subglobosum LB1]
MTDEYPIVSNNNINSSNSNSNSNGNGNGNSNGSIVLPPHPQRISIKKLLEENELFISTIVENQNANRLHECVVYQLKLHQNLCHLAAIADTQQQLLKQQSLHLLIQKTQQQQLQQAQLQQQQQLLQQQQQQQPKHTDTNQSKQMTTSPPTSYVHSSSPTFNNMESSPSQDADNMDTAGGYSSSPPVDSPPHSQADDVPSQMSDNGHHQLHQAQSQSQSQLQQWRNNQKDRPTSKYIITPSNTDIASIFGSHRFPPPPSSTTTSTSSTPMPVPAQAPAPTHVHYTQATPPQIESLPPPVALATHWQTSNLLTTSQKQQLESLQERHKQLQAQIYTYRTSKVPKLKQAKSPFQQLQLMNCQMQIDAWEQQLRKIETILASQPHEQEQYLEDNEVKKLTRQVSSAP